MLIEAALASLAELKATEQGPIVKYEQQKALKAAMLKLEATKSERVQKEQEANMKVNSARAKQQDALRQAAAIEREHQDIAVKLGELYRLSITAPEDGTLIRSNIIRQGQAIKEGDELFTIDPDISERAVELWISGDDAWLVQRGDRVQLQFEGWPAVESMGLFQGRVTTVYPRADGAWKIRILVKENGNDSWPDERYLRPGVRASGWVITAAQ